MKDNILEVGDKIIVTKYGKEKTAQVTRVMPKWIQIMYDDLDSGGQHKMGWVNVRENIYRLVGGEPIIPAITEKKPEQSKKSSGKLAYPKQGKKKSREYKGSFRKYLEKKNTAKKRRR